jgi:hypothetical protein
MAVVSYGYAYIEGSVSGMFVSELRSLVIRFRSSHFALHFHLGLVLLFNPCFWSHTTAILPLKKDNHSRRACLSVSVCQTRL